ncbi:LCP family protein [Pectinatus sottacetonis]|uniref:LCP family protein n=1 Tax=Pectinatus sottacetonis TaxID=1002795 RepID=UPI0018C5FF9D|nr:LCP family protein [Pectinatus sottacetonis]
MAEKKLKYKRNYRRIIALGIIFFTIAVAAFAYNFIKHDNDNITNKNMKQATNKVTIMIMGVDSRKDDVGRSDTLMLLVIDKKTDEVSLLSIPRDTRVKIKGHEYNKINHAYAYGGHELTKNTVENLLDIPINYYVLINMESFKKIVNDLGGIDLKVEKRMYYNDPWDDNGGLHIDLYPGMQHLDGEKAVEYVRFRDSEGDIGRIARQQHFIKAVLEKVLTPAVLPKIPSLIKELSSTIKTDMPVTEMMSYAKLLPGLKNKKIAATMLPGSPLYINDISYWIPDIKLLRHNIAKLLGQTITQAMADNTEETIRQYAQSLPVQIKMSEQDKQIIADKEQKNKDDVQLKDTTKPNDITVMVINSSGIDGAGAAAADVLKHKGFNISSVETGHTSANQQTKIIASKNAVNLFYGMPFPCVIMAGNTSGHAVLDIGRDYKK